MRYYKNAKLVTIDPADILSLLRGDREAGPVEIPHLPDDVACLGAWFDYRRNVLAIAVHSREFPPVPCGAALIEEPVR